MVNNKQEKFQEFFGDYGEDVCKNGCDIVVTKWKDENGDYWVKKECNKCSIYEIKLDLEQYD